jgi:rubrerythrin
MTALEFAIEMELDGQKYYLEQAKLNETNSVKSVCLILARDEEAHAQILKHKLSELPYALADTDTYSQMKNLFKDLENFKSDLRETPTQFEFYRSALKNEKQSIDLYTELLAKTEDEKEQELFQYLIEQEKLHYSLLDELSSELRHAEEWVESAEFGLRNEDY